MLKFSRQKKARRVKLRAWFQRYFFISMYWPILFISIFQNLRIHIIPDITVFFLVFSSSGFFFKEIFVAYFVFAKDIPSGHPFHYKLFCCYFVYILTQRFSCSVNSKLLCIKLRYHVLVAEPEGL